MADRPRLVQILAWFLAAAAAVGAGAMQSPLAERRVKDALIVPESLASASQAEQKLLTMLPGGLRAPLLSYLWITAQDLKDRGRVFDAMQRASLICHFQPHFAEVWNFQAWNMAWNISVATHTPDERWRWVVGNGVGLLRDEAIPNNPKALSLYRNLAWIFFSKMGGTTDEMHLTYKRRWAVEMQHLLASPPYGSTADAIAAFRPIAQTPLDRSPQRSRDKAIQADKLRELSGDPKVAAYASLLEAQGVAVGKPLLQDYNRLSRDEGVEAYRGRTPYAETERDRALLDLYNNAQYAEARGKLLAFCRAQILWNGYKMDPQWMLKLMEQYGPLDWRLVQTHALYWSSYGIHVCQSTELTNFEAINSDRLVLFCLKDFAFSGRLVLIHDPEAPDRVRYGQFSDLRFVDRAHEEFLYYIDIMNRAEEQAFRNNVLRDGHINFLAAMIDSLYAVGARQKAQYYLDWVKGSYGMRDMEWAFKDVDGFVRYRLSASSMSPQTALSQISLSLGSGYARLAAGDLDAFHAARNYAVLVHRVYHEGRTPEEKAARRNWLPPLQQLEWDVVRSLVVRPEIFGYRLSLLDRSGLFKQLPVEGQLAIYDWILPPLEQECRDRGEDFSKAFPVPPGIEEYRARGSQQLEVR